MEKYGVVNGVARDPRCEHCMVHCGYDPSGALGTNYQSGDNWKNIKYNFGANRNRSHHRPNWLTRVQWRDHRKGHLAEAKAAINSPAAGARGAFSNEVITNRMSPAIAAPAKRPNAMTCWRKSKTRKRRSQLLNPTPI